MTKEVTAEQRKEIEGILYDAINRMDNDKRDYYRKMIAELDNAEFYEMALFMVQG